VESYDTFEITNEKDPNNTVTEYIGPAFEEHRAALQELATVIAQHEEAVAHMVKSCTP
jgi:phage shock protein A